MQYWLWYVVVISLIQSLSASSGDRSQVFQQCLARCSRKCDGYSYPAKLPFYLVIFGWSCEDECKYKCMQDTTKYFIASDYGIQKFYGKWPFTRFLGIQEPASALFSIGNCLGHCLGWLNYYRNVDSRYSMYTTWKIYAMISINAWIWSVVFHIRDLSWTEKLDYFGGTSIILVSIYAFFVRTVGFEGKQKWRCRLYALFVILLFCCHCGYLSFIHFDYSYNMKASLSAALINVVGWLLWCYKHYKKRSYVWKCAFTNIMLFILISLEIFDFPPIYGILDSHALWHLTTIPFCYLWYCFLRDDANFDAYDEKMK